MTEPRPYRAGLGIPEAKIIRSSPLPTTSEPILYDPTDYPEWNVNPTRHGPERLRRPPNFTPSQAVYDELGRSMLDGVGVEVEQGKMFAEGGKAKAAGGEVADWYSALASKPLSPQNEGDGERVNAEAGPSRRLPRAQIVELKPTIDCLEASIPGRQALTTAPLRVNRKEWFIRRALLTASQKGDPSPPRQAPKPSDISSMLHIDSAPKPAKPIQYVLGPENVGHAILRNRLGWEGGGLGRPEGWDEEKWQAHLSRQRDLAARDIPPARFSDDLVDLTADSDEGDAPDDGEEEVFASGPGRVAPVATSLKLDRLGIGHRRGKDRKIEGVAKRVTHSAADLRDAQRRARVIRPVQGVELGKKGKVKWRDRDKRERDARQRLLTALNA